MVTGTPGINKMVYQFSEGDASMNALLGGREATYGKWSGWGSPCPPDL